MQFVPPVEGPRTWIGRAVFSLIFGLMGLSLWVGLLLQIPPLYEQFRDDYFIPIVFPDGLPSLWSETLAEWSLVALILLGVIFGWNMGGATRDKWRRNLLLIQWVGLVFALVSTVILVQLIPPFLDSLDVSRLQCYVGYYPWLGVGIIAPTALTWASACAMFLAAFWWGKEIDSDAFRDSLETETLLGLKRRRALIQALAFSSPHPGHLIVQLTCYPMLVIGSVWAGIHFRERIRFSPVEQLVGNAFETSIADTASTQKSPMVVIKADGTITAERTTITSQKGGDSMSQWIIRAAPSVPHQRLIDVLDSASCAGVQRFSLLELEGE